MTPKRIEEWRKLLIAEVRVDSDELCDLALDGLRWRKYVEAREHTRYKLYLSFMQCDSLETYREAIDKFVVERKG